MGGKIKMIIEFSISNFRSIKEKVTLSFNTKSKEGDEYFTYKMPNGKKILKLGFIYGANASGKTNVLLALDFLRNLVLQPFDKKTESFNFEPFLFDNDYKLNKNTSFSLDFFQNGTRYIYELTLNRKTILEEELHFYSPKKSLIYKRTTKLGSQLSKISFGQKIKIDKNSKKNLIGNTLWNNTVLGGFLKTNMESTELQEVIDWFLNKLKPIIAPETALTSFVSDRIEDERINKEIVIEILQKADFNISDINYKKKIVSIDDKSINISKESLIPNQNIEWIKGGKIIESTEILFKHLIEDDEFLLPIDVESAGTKRYYGLSGMLSLILNERSILSIDEIESSLHPDLVKHFIITFLVNSRESQLIATTHNRELLMERDILLNDSIWFTEKKEDGSTELYSVSDFDTSTIRNTSSIYNAYKIGKLGAVPDTADYYIEHNDEKK